MRLVNMRFTLPWLQFGNTQDVLRDGNAPDSTALLVIPGNNTEPLRGRPWHNTQNAHKETEREFEVVCILEMGRNDREIPLGDVPIRGALWGGDHFGFVPFAMAIPGWVDHFRFPLPKPTVVVTAPTLPVLSGRIPSALSALRFAAATAA